MKLNFKILGIDTSGESLGISLSEDGRIIGNKLFVDKKFHSARLIPLIKELLKEKAINILDINCLAVTTGPGSYTGIRIGITTIKAMAYALSIPCIGIPTTEVTSVDDLVLLAYKKFDELKTDSFNLIPNYGKSLWT